VLNVGDSFSESAFLSIPNSRSIMHRLSSLFDQFPAMMIAYHFKDPILLLKSEWGKTAHYNMMLGGSSRPGSGAEHIFGHCLDKLFPSRSRLQGVQVEFDTFVTVLNMISREQAYLTERLTPLLRERRLSRGFGDSKNKGGSDEGRI
jgi:hypothetical protein